MPDNRYYVEGEIREEVHLDGQELKHLVKVMRKRVGDAVEVVNGRGVLGKGVVKGEGVITIVEKEERVEKGPILAQGIIRKLDLVVEKATELGVEEIWIFPADRSEKKQVRLDRLEAVAIAAMKQCGRLWLPKIVMKGPLKEWKKPEEDLIYGDPQGGEAVGKILAIGPEGGWSDAEMRLLAKMGKGVKLNQHVLRAETAAIAGTALLAKHFESE